MADVVHHPIVYSKYQPVFLFFGAGDNKERPVSLLEFLGNEKLVEMSERTGLELEKVILDKLATHEEDPAELVMDADPEVQKTVSSPRKPSPAVKASDTGAKKEADEGEKPKKAMPPKPWLQKKKKTKKENQDPFVIDFPQLEEPPKVDSQPAADSDGVVLDERVVGNSNVEEAKPENKADSLPSPREDSGIGDVDAGLTQEQQQQQQQSGESNEVFEFGDEDFRPADDGNFAIGIVILI